MKYVADSEIKNIFQFRDKSALSFSTGQQQVYILYELLNQDIISRSLFSQFT